MLDQMQKLFANFIALGQLGAPRIRPSKGSTPNKYKPHQGKQECARRRKIK
jgi:hypothetical protein